MEGKNLSPYTSLGTVKSHLDTRKISGGFVLPLFLATALAVAYDVDVIWARSLSTDSSSMSPWTVLASFSHLVPRSVPHVGFGLVPHVKNVTYPSPSLVSHFPILPHNNKNQGSHVTNVLHKSARANTPATLSLCNRTLVSVMKRESIRVGIFFFNIL